MSSPVQDLSVLHQRREQRLMLALALPALLVILLLVVLTAYTLIQHLRY